MAALGLALASGAAAQDVNIRRTTDGIPHILATDWNGLGFGYGLAQSQDAFCTLAEAFVTFRGERSLHFGADGRPDAPSIFDGPTNIDLDFFFRWFLTDEQVSRFIAQQPPELLALIDGFAAGFNRHLAEVARQPRLDPPACRGASWLAGIHRDDVIRRMLAVNLAAGYAKFIPEIVRAAPAAGAALSPVTGTLTERLASSVSGARGLGSNMLAFGSEVTGGPQALLLGNPHWFWSGPDRLYQAQLTIPGVVNVAGVSLLGVPVIMIGFTRTLAWSHTVSPARRFGLFDLTLQEGRPDAYRRDGEVHPMTSRRIAVPVRDTDGRIGQQERTLYRSEFGPMIDLSERAAEFGWNRQRALAIRDINEDNFRSYRTWFRWSTAKSLDKFVEIQRDEVAIPWVHTVAIGAGDGRVWYSDIGTVPNVSDALRKECSTTHGDKFAEFDPTVPVVDGSRSSCDWTRLTGRHQNGTLPWQALPSFFRSDYVVNTNDSYWLTNAFQPIEGYPRTLGGEREELSMRCRHAHQLAARILPLAPIPVSSLSRIMSLRVLDATSYTAALFRSSLLDGVCDSKSVRVGHDVLTGKAFTPPREVDLSRACAILRQWHGTADVDDKGAILWDAVWNRVLGIPHSSRYRIPFSTLDPLGTPRALDLDNPEFKQAFGAAVLSLSDAGLPLDLPMGSRLTLGTTGARLPLFGGCGDSGYLTVACDESGNYDTGSRTFFGNSYLQLVHFDRNGPRAFTLLSHGQEDHAVSRNSTDPGRLRYLQRRWLDFPFSEADIAAHLVTNESIVRKGDRTNEPAISGRSMVNQ